MNITKIIGHLMAATGKSVEEIAKEHGYSKATFYGTINCRTKSRKVREIIIEITGLKEDELWPTEDGYKNRPERPGKETKKRLSP